MRNNPSDGGEPSVWRRTLQIPRLYSEFVRYQPSLVGRLIALIPVFVLLVALVLLVI